MVRYFNATVTILEESEEMNSEGDLIQSFTEIEEIVGDVQPHVLTESEMKVFGISESKGNVKMFLYNGLHPNVKVGNRARVDSQLTGREDLYEIMPVNAWTRHGECLLVPVENEEEE